MKKLVLLVIALITILSFVGCGEKANVPTDGNNQQTIKETIEVDDIDAFNAKFEKYLGNNVKGTVVSVAMSATLADSHGVVVVDESNNPVSDSSIDSNGRYSLSAGYGTNGAINKLIVGEAKADAE